MNDLNNALAKRTSTILRGGIFTLGLALGSLGIQGQDRVPVDAFDLPDDLEVSLWATSPLFYNPTNIDVDHKGRIWVAEGVNYRKFRNKTSRAHPVGDRIMILEDTDGDGVEDALDIDADGDGSVIDDVAGMLLGGNKKQSGGLGGLLGGLFGK